MSWKPWNTVVTKPRQQAPDRRPITTRIRELLDGGFEAPEIIEDLTPAETTEPSQVLTRGQIARVASLAKLDHRGDPSPALPPRR